MINDLREFIEKLEAHNELVRVKEKVSPILEIAEITDRISKSPHGGKALLFENVEGSAIPVLINAFGSWKRIHLALGVDNLESIQEEIDRFLKLAPPANLLEKARLLPMVFQMANVPPKIVSAGVCQEVVHTGDDIDLFKFPILQCWPNDAGRFITFPMVINRSVDRKIRNVGLYRMQVFDNKTTAIHWHIHKDGAHFFHEYRKQDKVMEVAVAIGADPVTCYSASAPLPYGIDEFLLAGFIRKEPVSLVKCKTIDLEVPANAEIVLEGYIDPSDLRKEGPFGDHTGYYSQDGDYPVFHITAITHRKNPVYLTTIVGIPPQEDYYLGKASERIFLPLMRTQLPEVIDMNMPLEGVFHNCVIISIDKRYPLQARKVMSALWGMGQMSFVKTIVVVDMHVNVHDEKGILKKILNEVDFNRDLFFSEGILDVLNHASDNSLYGSKLGIDMTAWIEGEPRSETETQQEPASKLDLPHIVHEKFEEVVDCRILELETRRSVMMVTYKKTKPRQPVDFIHTLFKFLDMASISIMLVFESHVDLDNNSMLLWKLFNNLDPFRDFHFVDGHLGIDLTQKMPEEGYNQKWPEEIKMSPEVKERVNSIWEKLFQPGL
ncbi:MAG: menaquinone biosynthesis decarboxylase [Nitrospinaceae bacterium]